MTRTVIPVRARLIPEGAKRVFEGVIYDVYHWEQNMYDGTTATFEMVKRPDTVKVIAIKDHKVVILEEEQPHLGAFFEIPGGMHDVESEDELAAAKREVLEETGFKFKNWKLLTAFQPSDSVEQIVYIFLASDFESSQEPHYEAGEKIEVRLLSLDEVKDLLKSPKNRYLPKEIFESVNSVEELLQLPEYSAK